MSPPDPETVLSTGSPDVDGTRIPPGSDRKRVVLVEGGSEHEIGWATEDLSLIEEDGRLALKRVQTLDSSVFGRRTTTSLFVRGSLEPLWHRTAVEDRVITAEYRGLHVVRRHREGGRETMREDIDLSSGRFDVHGIELLLRALPIEKGWEARIVTYDPVAGAERDVEAHVVRREGVEVGGGRLAAAWVVDVDFGAVCQRYWVGTDYPELLRQSTMLPDESVVEFVR